MRITLLLTLCLMLVACGASGPGNADIRNAFEQDMPAIVELKSFTLENPRNAGSDERPVWVARTIAEMALRETTYDIETVEGGVRILKPVRQAGEPFSFYGTVRSERSGDGWRHSFRSDGSSNPVMGRPRSDYGPDALIADSPEAKALLAKIAQEKEQARIAEETRIAEEAAEQKRREEAEAAKRQRIEAAVAKHSAAFAPEEMVRLELRHGEKIALLVTGSAEGPGRVWGTDRYTGDSDFSKSVVHAGLLKPGETGIVEVTSEDSWDFFGSPRNGINSENYTGRAAYAYTLRLLERIPSE